MVLGLKKRAMVPGRVAQVTHQGESRTAVCLGKEGSSLLFYIPSLGGIRELPGDTNAPAPSSVSDEDRARISSYCRTHKILIC